MPDNERFIRGIKRKTGAARVRLPFQVLNKIARVFRESDFQVRCVIRTSANKEDIFVYDVYPKDAEVVIGGLAVDIGTHNGISTAGSTWRPGKLSVKHSAGNGQIRYGADVIKPHY